MAPPANDHNAPLSRLEAIAAVVTLKDPDILETCPRRERIEAIHDLILLGLIGLFQFGLWAIAFSKFNAPFPGAMAGALLIAAIIVAIDVRMTASDTLPRGVLRQGPWPRTFYWFLGSRILISLVLANATATGLDLVIFQQEAIQVMEKDRDAQNRPIIAEYDQKLAALRAQEVGPLEIEVASLTDQRTHALSEASRAGDKIASAHDGAAAADLERERQVNGVDARLQGDGPLAKDAAKRLELATEQALLLAGRQKDLAQDAERLSQESAAANIQLAQVQPRYAAAVRNLESERDARLVKATTGPLTVVLGLLKLRQDPEQGGAVTLVTFLSWSGIMVLELSFFLARSLFKPASFHDLAVNTDLQRRAAALAHDFTEEIRETRRRQPLRVVGDDDPAP